MKNEKILIIGIIIVILLIIAGVLTNYIDSGRVTTNHEPKCCIKTISKDGSKVTYWGLGYKVIRYVGISPNEPYENNISAKMGSWFMKYELPQPENIEIEYEGQRVTITNIKDIGTIENILLNSKYNNEVCRGEYTYKITLNNEVYYIKESCREIQKGNKKAKITDEDLNKINNIIANIMNNNPITMIIKENTLTNEGITLILKNNSEQTYHYGPQYYLEKYDNGEFSKIEPKETLSWIDVLYNIKASEKKEEVINWEVGYDKLGNGTYRLVKEFISEENITSSANVQEKSFVEFEIK